MTALVVVFAVVVVIFVVDFAAVVVILGAVHCVTSVDPTGEIKSEPHA